MGANLGGFGALWRKKVRILEKEVECKVASYSLHDGFDDFGKSWRAPCFPSASPSRFRDD